MSVGGGFRLPDPAPGLWSPTSCPMASNLLARVLAPSSGSQIGPGPGPPKSGYCQFCLCLGRRTRRASVLVGSALSWAAPVTGLRDLDKLCHWGSRRTSGLWAFTTCWHPPVCFGGVCGLHTAVRPALPWMPRSPGFGSPPFLSWLPDFCIGTIANSTFASAAGPAGFRDFTSCRQHPPVCWGGGRPVSRCPGRGRRQWPCHFLRCRPPVELMPLPPVLTMAISCPGPDIWSGSGHASGSGSLPALTPTQVCPVLRAALGIDRDLDPRPVPPQS